MPPPQSLLALKIQGFVCRSCLSKLRVSRNPRPLWLVRSVVNDNGPPLTRRPNAKKNASDQCKHKTKPMIRVFDQGPDGIRTEITQDEDPADEAVLESLQSTTQDIRKEMVEESGTEDVDEQELESRVIGRHMDDVFQGEAFEEYIVSQFEEHMDEIDAEVDKRMEDINVQNMSAEKRSDVRKKLRNEVKNAARSPQPTSSPRTSKFSSRSSAEPGFLIPNSEFPTIQRHIDHLNGFIRVAARNLDEGTYSSKRAHEAWRAYNRCRLALLAQLNSVPSEAWQLLWTLFADPKDLHNKYLRRLGEDMTNAGLPLQDWQRLHYISATFAEGGDRTTIAIEQWEGEAKLGYNPDYLKGYWELGVSMYSQTHQLDKALRAAEALVEASKEDPTEFRIFILIIDAFLSSNEKEKEQKAWALYVRLRLGLGPRMELRDFDAVVSMFFKAELPDLALSVFRDMMLTGDVSAAEHDSLMKYGDGPGVKSNLELMEIGEKELEWDDPRVLARLPSKFNNKFFFGKWLKKLIAEGEFKASISVFNLMHERGIRADPRYLNGLIGAWLRTGIARNHTLAEDTAWRMIRERLHYIENQKTAAQLATFPVRAVGWKDKRDHKSLFIYPMATIETFAVLIQDYRRRQRHDRMKDLFAALEQAKVKPNTFFMNQMIMVESEAQHFWAWDMYSGFTTTHRVSPDFGTFAFLWYLTKQAVDPTFRHRNKQPRVARDVPNYVVPRMMFAEMIKWASTLTSKSQLPRELYDMIILSFSLAQDRPGAAVALRALQRHFNMFPDENTVRTIVLQLARAGFENEHGHTPRRLNFRKSAIVQERVVQVTRLLESFKKRRVDALLDGGVIFEELQGDAKLEESLLLMSELLRHVADIKLEEPALWVSRVSKKAAKEMLVPDCNVWEDTGSAERLATATEIALQKNSDRVDRNEAVSLYQKINALREIIRKSLSSSPVTSTELKEKADDLRTSSLALFELYKEDGEADPESETNQLGKDAGDDEKTSWINYS